MHYSVSGSRPQLFTVSGLSWIPKGEDLEVEVVLSKADVAYACSIGDAYEVLPSHPCQVLEVDGEGLKGRRRGRPYSSPISPPSATS